MTRTASARADLTAKPVFTVGHSTRSISAFVTLLQAGQVELVIDIRRIPRSRTNPQFNVDVLASELAPFQIQYTRIAELGGRRAAAKLPAEINGFWTHRGFHNYADYALSDDFRAGLTALLDLSSRQRSAIMCAEAVWWRCHRRIVADYLINKGRPVFHLMGETDVRPATMTPGAVGASDGVRYPGPGR